MAGSDCRAFLAITDRLDIPPRIKRHGVVYRPPSLVWGWGCTGPLPADKIVSCVNECLAGHNLSRLSVARMASPSKSRSPSRASYRPGERMNVPGDIRGTGHAGAGRRAQPLGRGGKV